MLIFMLDYYRQIQKKNLNHRFVNHYFGLLVFRAIDQRIFYIGTIIYTSGWAKF
jgi:hypothetical protein